jgi:hypothetical protein
MLKEQNHAGRVCHAGIQINVERGKRGSHLGMNAGQLQCQDLLAGRGKTQAWLSELKPAVSEWRVAGGILL